VPARNRYVHRHGGILISPVRELRRGARNE
jgi:hypothetical protein